MTDVGKLVLGSGLGLPSLAQPCPFGLAQQTIAPLGTPSDFVLELLAPPFPLGWVWLGPAQAAPSRGLSLRLG